MTIIEFVFLIILISSLAGIGIMVFRKIPRLVKLPETSPPIDWRKLFSKAKDVKPLRSFSSEMLLQKVLSKVRIITLRTDSKTSSWLQKLRERSQKDKFGENDTYWKDIRRSTKK